MSLCTEKSWWLGNSVFSKRQHHGPRSLCGARLGEGVCLSPGVCEASKTRSLIAKHWLTGQLLREEGRRLSLCSRPRLCCHKGKLLRCPWEPNVLVKIYKQAVSDAEACRIAVMVSTMHFTSVNTPSSRLLIYRRNHGGFKIVYVQSGN